MKSKSLILFLGLCLGACVNPYDVTIKSSAGYVVIDGGVTDADEPQHLTLSRTSATQSGTTNDFVNIIIQHGTVTSPISNANVTVVVNGSQTIQLTESKTDAGEYDFPLDFRGKVGNTYQVKFQLNGNTYQSSIEKMVSTSAVKKIYNEFNLKGIEVIHNGVYGHFPTNDIFIDFDDDPSVQNFYRWTSKVYESQTICQSCKQGRYYWYPHQQGIKGDCFTDLSLLPTNYFDYPCATPTWDIFYQNNINIFSDIYTNGKPQVKKLVAQIEMRQANPCLLVLYQSSLTQGAYHYLKLINDQATNTGSLADTPPGSLQGNVQNLVDTHELVLGYFLVSSVTEVRYMVDRKNDVDDSLIRMYDYLFYYENDRLLYFEPPSFERPQQISAIGTESSSRTLIQPKGWSLDN